MITIEIPKKELLSQLPDKAGYALIQWLDEMPDVFVFQGNPIKTSEDLLMQKYPQIYREFTHTEWQLLLCLYRRGKVKYSTLLFSLKLEDDSSFLSQSNVLTAHIKNMRHKIKILGFPLRVVTFRQSSYRPGFYKLIEMS